MNNNYSLTKKILFSALVVIVTTALVYGFLLSQRYINSSIYRAVGENLTLLFMTAVAYGSFLLGWILCLIYIFIVKSDRPMLTALGTKYPGNRLSLLLWGFLAGLLFNLFFAVVAMLNGDISISFREINILPLLLMLVVMFIQCSWEEMLYRGMIYQKLLKITGSPVAAIFLNPLIFAVTHILNPGTTVLAIINIYLIGLFFSMVVYYFNSVWFCFAFHTAWNFTQTCILGLLNSGQQSLFSIFVLDPSTARSSFFYDASFGVEGPFFTSLIFMIACVVLWLLRRKKPVPSFNIWEKR